MHNLATILLTSAENSPILIVEIVRIADEQALLSVSVDGFNNKKEAGTPYEADGLFCLFIHL